ncbi:maltokinase N-terminal cap-like domain-containing protein [Marinactinospora thermotolerans]|uniref:Maltokinase n=1 Tax=Marinactinospora thermotolerans DSM 45154 TaxID=1122192 RepID=A0A1T4SEB6_9ACTN|nr:phosphotransferase [Marinactinospora thermotolerans]SKA26515.1 maltokinase [Marinactinospora thermotolerans DSM 45154]
MTQLEELLATWIPRQRWFAGKGLPIDALRVESQHVLVPGTPGLRVLVVEVGQHGRTDRYQVLLGLRPEGSIGADLAHAAIGVCELPGGAEGTGGPCVQAVYDATHDPEMTARLLEHIARGHAEDGVRFRRMPDTEIHTGLRSLVLTGEQSNTSLVYGEEYVLKMFRRLWPGHNPDLELTAALSGSPFVARPYGWIETDLRDSAADTLVPTTLAMLQRYLRSATDGWVLAATSVRDLYASPGVAPEDAGGDFSGEAERLGAATAAVHRDLARALPTDVLTPESQGELAESMVSRLDVAASQITALEPYAPALRDAFDAFADLDTPLPVQRVHGDYHLGQVVRTDSGWVLLDFEGEPAAPITERQRLSSPLRDVAGMLRSFDYAARHQLVGHAREDELAEPARAWAQRNREAFCAGYAFGGGIDPEKHQVVLRAFEYDKAVYEVMYEARHRPAWMRIPLDSIAALVA